MANARGKRLRRQAKQALKFGKTAKPTHRLKTGRTGKAFAKKLKGLLAELKRVK